MNIIKKPIVKTVLANFICLILILIYLGIFNIQIINFQVIKTNQFINISSIIFLIISITILEIAYRKEKAQIFSIGIEILIFAIMTLLIKYLPKAIGYTIEKYTQTLIFIFVIYYILKCAILYTKMKYDELKNLSDIKEIVKEEPIKKEAKRKNKKIVEEGK